MCSNQGFSYHLSCLSCYRTYFSLKFCRYCLFIKFAVCVHFICIFPTAISWLFDEIFYNFRLVSVCFRIYLVVCVYAAVMLWPC